MSSFGSFIADFIDDRGDVRRVLPDLGKMVSRLAALLSHFHYALVIMPDNHRQWLQPERIGTLLHQTAELMANEAILVGSLEDLLNNMSHPVGNNLFDYSEYNANMWGYNLALACSHLVRIRSPPTYWYGECGGFGNGALKCEEDHGRS